MTHPKIRTLVAVLAGTSALLVSAQASAQTTTPAARGDSPPRTASAPAKLARADTGFMRQAAENGHAEMEGSKLALQKATHPQVKSFAQKMVDDHGKTAAELDALAASKGIKLPAEPSVTQKARLKLLGTADGARFDQRYAEELGVKAHEDTVKLFRKASTEATDPDVKAFATKTLPALEQHLQMARELKTATAGAKESAGAAPSGTTKPSTTTAKP